MLCWWSCLQPASVLCLPQGCAAQVAAQLTPGWYSGVGSIFLNSLQLLTVCMCLQVSGDITYNGEGFEFFQVARTSAYISQVDEHQAELTVRETFDFAARCLGVGHKQGMPLSPLPAALSGLPAAML
jgi:hypothetical protein